MGTRSDQQRVGVFGGELVGLERSRGETLRSVSKHNLHLFVKGLGHEIHQDLTLAFEAAKVIGGVEGLGVTQAVEELVHPILQQARQGPLEYSVLAECLEPLPVLR